MRESIVEGLRTPVGDFARSNRLVNWTLCLPTSKKRRKEACVFWAEGPGICLLDIVKANPYQTLPPYEKLVGDLAGGYSRRINIQHRLVYQVLDDAKVVKVIRMWTHYE